MRFCTALALCAALLASSGAARTQCRQALALGLDVSGSVDPREYRMQLDGLANALLHPEVRQAIFAMPGAPVHIAIFEWSGPDDQFVLQPWTAIESEPQLRAVAARLAQLERTPADQSTALGQAMLFGAQMLSSKQGCWLRTLDISGDGKSNTGPPPNDIARANFAGLVINALVIGADALDHGDSRQAEIGELSSYFNAYVIHGPNSFVEVALGFEDYERAMVRKLKREMQGFSLSGLPRADQ